MTVKWAPVQHFIPDSPIVSVGIGPYHVISRVFGLADQQGKEGSICVTGGGGSAINRNDMVFSSLLTTRMSRKPTHSMYMMTPSDHMSHDLSYFSGPRTSGAARRKPISLDKAHPTVNNNVFIHKAPYIQVTKPAQRCYDER